MTLITQRLLLTVLEKAAFLMFNFEHIFPHV